MRRGLAAAAVAVAVLAGCGAPAKLSDEDGRAVAAARERLDDAIDSEETLRTSREEARRLRRGVARIVSDGSFEDSTLDEFGIAKLGQLRELVPSLVIADRDDTVRALDRPATADFLRYAERDPGRALLRPARRQVGLLVDTLEQADAGRDTEIPVLKASAVELLRQVERDLGRIWPSLARRVAEARADL